MINVPTTNSTQIIYAKEQEWGVPAIGEYTALDIKGQTLDITSTSVESTAIRSDRNIPDAITTAYETAGQIEFEFALGAYDELIAGALFNEWSEPLDISVAGEPITIASTENEIIHTEQAPIFENIVVGQWLKIKSDKNNDFYQVATVSEDKDRITLSGNALIDDQPSTLEISGSFIRNGTKNKSYTFERQHLDIEQYFLFKGAYVSQLSLNYAFESILEGSIGLLAKDVTLSDTTQSVQINSAPSTGMTTSVDNLGHIRESGNAQAYAQNLNLEIENNLRGQKALGDSGLVGVAAGRCRVTGKLEIFFVDGKLYKKYRDGAPISLDWRVSDANGNTLIITLPKCKLTGGSISAGGSEENVVAAFDFQAVLDPSTNCAIQIDRF